MPKKTSQLTPAASVASTDIVHVVVGMAGGAPRSRKATLAQLLGLARLSVYDEGTLLGQYHTLKFAGLAVTVTETAVGEATVTIGEAAGGPASHIGDVTVPGKPAVPGVTLYRLVAPVPMTMPANFAGSRAFAEVAPTANTVFYLNKNGTSIGTLTFAAGSQVGTFSGTPGGAAVSFAAGDWLKLYTGTVQDATLADLGISLLLFK